MLVLVNPSKEDHSRSEVTKSLFKITDNQQLEVTENALITD